MLNTIIAANSGGDCTFTGTVTSQGRNLDGDGTCNLTDGSDLPGSTALLATLQNNGGPTLTHALLTGSPALDAGDDTSAPATDQRGTARPQGSASDIGAFELAVATPTPTPVPGVGAWGLAAMALVLLVIAPLYLRHRSASQRP